MITVDQLTSADRSTYHRILQEPAVTDLCWEKVRSLLETLGQVREITAGGLHITRNGHVLELPNTDAKKVETTEALLTLRKFLKRSDIPPHCSNGREAHLLLVIGHHEARVFRSVVEGGVTEQLLPTQNHGCFTIMNSDGEKIREPNTGFEPIAKALRATGNILIFGESSTSQQEMDQFVIWLKQQHPELADRIIGSLVLEHDQVTSSFLLAKARSFHARVRPSACPTLSPGESPN